MGVFMPDKTFYAAIIAGVTATLGFFKSGHSIRKGQRELGKRVGLLENDVRSCVGTNRDSYVEKGFCSLQSKTLEGKVDDLKEQTKEVRDNQKEINAMITQIHAVACKGKEDSKE